MSASSMNAVDFYELELAVRGESALAGSLAQVGPPRERERDRERQRERERERSLSGGPTERVRERETERQSEMSLSGGPSERERERETGMAGGPTVLRSPAALYS
jgi:hypothetical protein